MVPALFPGLVHNYNKLHGEERAIKDTTLVHTFSQLVFDSTWSIPSMHIQCVCVNAPPLTSSFMLQRLWLQMYTTHACKCVSIHTFHELLPARDTCARPLLVYAGIQIVMSVIVIAVRKVRKFLCRIICMYVCVCVYLHVHVVVGMHTLT